VNNFTGSITWIFFNVLCLGQAPPRAIFWPLSGVGLKSVVGGVVLELAHPPV